ncbi:MAG: tetratricopeptide repeat-containing sensor histidine kinase [Ignavibacteria bacterium]|jgi:signal transduction histidine kinase
MKTILLILYYTVVPSKIGLSNNLDSLINLLKITEGKGKLNLYVQISKRYVNSSPIKGIEIATAGVCLAKKLNDKNIEIQLYQNIGLNFRVLGNYKNSLTNYLTALRISDETHNYKEKANSLNSIGNVYNYIGNFSKALEYYESALEIRKRINDQIGIAGTLNNIGNIHIKNKEPDLALNYLTRSLNLKLKLNEFASAVTTYKNIGNIYLERKQVDSSIIYFDDALNIEKSHYDSLGMTSSYILLSNAYIKKNNLSIAESLVNKAFKIASRIGANHELMRCYYNFSKIYSEKAQYKTALDYLRKHLDIRNEIYKNEITRQSLEVEAIYENLAAEQEIKNLELSEQTLQRNIFIITTILLSISAFAFVIYFREKEKSTKEIRRKNEELKIAAEKAERANKLKSDFLAQISHEIRTPINTIMNWTFLIKMEVDGKLSEDLKDCFISIENAATRLLRTIDLVLNMSDLETGAYEIFTSELKIKEEVLYPIYKEFERNNEDKTIDFKLLSSNDEDYPVIADKYTLNQIMANLIDNAFKYTKTGSIEIYVYKKDGKVAVDIKDTGIGISEKYLPNLFKKFSQEEQGYTRKYEGTGLGLSLVKKYCEINCCEIKVDSVKGQGTTFTIIFN